MFPTGIVHLQHQSRCCKSSTHHRSKRHTCTGLTSITLHQFCCCKQCRMNFSLSQAVDHSPDVGVSQFSVKSVHRACQRCPGFDFRFHFSRPDLVRWHSGLVTWFWRFSRYLWSSRRRAGPPCPLHRVRIVCNNFGVIRRQLFSNEGANGIPSCFGR